MHDHTAQPAERSARRRWAARPGGWLLAPALALTTWAECGCSGDEPAPAPRRPVTAPVRRVVDALPFEIDTPGTYALAGDLDGVPGEHGIVIRCSRVTVDLGGFALRGGVSSGTGILVEGERLGVSIRNGVLKAWGGDGLDASRSAECVLAGLEASLNGGAGLRCGPRARLSACRATFNWGGRGIDVGPESVVVDCAAEDNAFGGIHAGAGSELRASHSLRSTYGAGLRAGPASHLDGCVARDDLRQGIVVGAGSTVVNCRVERAVDVGLLAAEDCVLRDCDVRGVLDGDGIRTGERADLSGCRSYDNAGRGIAIGADSSLDGCETGGNRAEMTDAGAPGSPR